MIGCVFFEDFFFNFTLLYLQIIVCVVIRVVVGKPAYSLRIFPFLRLDLIFTWQLTSRQQYKHIMQQSKYVGRVEGYIITGEYQIWSTIGFWIAEYENRDYMADKLGLRP